MMRYWVLYTYGNTVRITCPSTVYYVYVQEADLSDYGELFINVLRHELLLGLLLPSAITWVGDTFLQFGSGTLRL